MKYIKIILTIITAILVLIVVGIIKFNIIADDVIITETVPTEEILIDQNSSPEVSVVSEENDSPTKELNANTGTDSITKNTWKWIRTVDASNTVFPSTPSKFIATFSKEKQFSTTTDCNSGSSTYTLNGKKLNIGMMASTMMFCENSNESSYFEMLSKVNEYTLDGKQLQLSLQDGRVMIFEKNA